MTKEPLIYETTRTFGTILENVAMDFRHRKTAAGPVQPVGGSTARAQPARTSS